MNYTKFYSLIDPLLHIVKKASDTILQIYNQGQYDIKYKLDESPVTIADIAANEIICQGLKDLTPEYPVISEENMETPYEVRKNFEYLWLIDPLDGTKEFMKGNGQFTINVALIHHGKSILGIVMAPYENKIYYAVKGCGAFMEYKGNVCRLNCNNISLSDEGLRFPISLSHINKDTKDYISSFNSPVTMPRGSALKFMMIANAEADIYPRMAPTMEWDTAAPHIIVEEAGGQLLQAESLQVLKYNKESLVNPGFITYPIINPQI